MIDGGANRHPKPKAARAMVQEIGPRHRVKDLAEIEAGIHGSLRASAPIRINPMRAEWLGLGLPLQSAA